MDATLVVIAIMCIACLARSITVVVANLLAVG